MHIYRLSNHLSRATQEPTFEKLRSKFDVVLTLGISLEYVAGASTWPPNYECFAGLTKGTPECLPGRRQAVCALRVRGVYG